MSEQPSSKELLSSLRYRAARLKCNLLGCLEADSYPGCQRCGCALYDPDYIVYGWLDPIFRFYWRARRFIRDLSPITHCDECGKRIVLGRPYTKDFCSEKCHDNWLPF